MGPRSQAACLFLQHAVWCCPPVGILLSASDVPMSFGALSLRPPSGSRYYRTAACSPPRAQRWSRSRPRPSTGCWHTKRVLFFFFGRKIRREKLNGVTWQESYWNQEEIITRMKLTEKLKSHAVIQFSGKSLGQIVRKLFFQKKHPFQTELCIHKKITQKRNLQQKKKTPFA